MITENIDEIVDVNTKQIVFGSMDHAVVWHGQYNASKGIQQKGEGPREKCQNNQRSKIRLLQSTGNPEIGWGLFFAFHSCLSCSLALNTDTLSCYWLNIIPCTSDGVDHFFLHVLHFRDLIVTHATDVIKHQNNIDLYFIYTQTPEKAFRNFGECWKGFRNFCFTWEKW